MSGDSKMDINEVFRGGGRSIEFLDEINKASIVMLDKTQILPHDIARTIARGIAKVIDDERSGTPRKSADYLDYEPRLIAAAGPEASRLHTGPQPAGHRLDDRAHEFARRAV